MISSFVKVILGVDKDANLKQMYLWNMIGTLTYALSTMIMTIVIARVLGDDIGGKFVIAITIAQWMATIAYFETRTYYITDAENKYQFSDYYSVKLITCILTILTSCIYVALQGYSIDKIIIVLLVCSLKLVDGFADLFEGQFQKNNRIDIAGKTLAIRTVASIVIVVVLSIITHNIIFTLIVANVVSILTVILFQYTVIGEFVELKLSWNKHAIRGIMIGSFPLFVSSFVSTYLSSASRFAVDKVLPSKFQLAYTAVFMPLMVINLFSGFMFKPMLSNMTDRYHEKRYSEFSKIIIKMFLGIVGFTVICMIGGYLIGIPVLSIMYSIDLQPFKMVLMVLLVAGGLNALSIILYYVLSIMRKQVLILTVYCMATLVVKAIAMPLTVKFGLMGAALAYFIVMFITCLSFVLIIIKKMKSKERVS